MKQYNYIFFDFDGTLVNTVEGTRRAAEYALKYFGIIEPYMDLGKIFCGPPLKQSFEKFGLHDDQVNKAIELYRKYQSENTIEINTLYKGIDELLKKLKELNKTLVIVTAKYEETTIKILKRLGIYQYFDFVYGSTGSNQNKSDLLKEASNKVEGIKIEECIMIGDRSSDIIAGKYNNMDTIGVLYGMDDKYTLKDDEATFLAESPYEIFNIVVNDEKNFTKNMNL